MAPNLSNQYTLVRDTGNFLSQHCRDQAMWRNSFFQYQDRSYICIFCFHVQLLIYWYWHGKNGLNILSQAIFFSPICGREDQATIAFSNKIAYIHLELDGNILWSWGERMVVVVANVTLSDGVIAATFKETVICHFFKQVISQAHNTRQLLP